MPLTAGTATADLTPPDGAIIACFPDRRGPEPCPRRAEGAYEAIEARVLALSDGERHLALCGLDLPGIRRGEVARIRERVAQSAPELADAGLALACSHTHSGPDTLYLFGGSPNDPWIERMVGLVADAVVEAHAKRVPAQISAAQISLTLNHNRRARDAAGDICLMREHESGTTEGPVDPDLTVLRVDAEDGPLAVAFHFTAHSLTLGPGNMRFSADYPGAARAVIDAALPGATSIFLNGAAGDVHPRRCMRSDREATEAVGSSRVDLQACKLEYSIVSPK